ncbi:hypothetical protein CcaCcLH18_07380 [Colletotrichum camelliae]|nr:hypothetical protein CcaCcLH18_07380 [Colletotrichum camelliae]
MSCSLFFSPTKGVTLRQGDTITVTWASGDIPNPPLVSDLNHISLTLENVLQSTNETLIPGYAFKYNTANWKDTGLEVGGIRIPPHVTQPHSSRATIRVYGQERLIHNCSGDCYIYANSDYNDDHDESSIYIGDVGNVYNGSCPRSIYRR